MNCLKYINQVFKVMTQYRNPITDKYDFSSFAPLTSRQLLLERYKKQDIPIYDDNPLEQTSGAYSIFRNPASEAELECRLNATKANKIQLLILIVTTITLAKSFL